MAKCSMNEESFRSLLFCVAQSIRIVHCSFISIIIDRIVDVSFVIVAYKHAMFNRLPILAFIPER